ncbi:MAG TPA: hypothetical protein VF493_12370, partial [Terriglobales bacterium]
MQHQRSANKHRQAAAGSATSRHRTGFRLRAHARADARKAPQFGNKRAPRAKYFGTTFTTFTPPLL